MTAPRFLRHSDIPSSECSYQVRTKRQFGMAVLTKDDLFEAKLDLIDFYLGAINRGIPLDKDRKKMCKKLLATTPSIAWQKENLLWFSHLSKEEQDPVLRYTGTEYVSMNDALRSDPHGRAIINELISKAPPLDNDIIVFRYIEDDKYIPAKGEFLSLGYLSVSFDILLPLAKVCNNDLRNIKGDLNTTVKLMRIKVKKGNRGIYIPGFESEIIFPHNIKMNILSKKVVKMICDNSKHTSLTRQCEFIEVLVYDAEF
jgi:hypothetical protein